MNVSQHFLSRKFLCNFSEYTLFFINKRRYPVFHQHGHLRNSGHSDCFALKSLAVIRSIVPPSTTAKRHAIFKKVRPLSGHS